LLPQEQTAELLPWEQLKRLILQEQLPRPARRGRLLNQNAMKVVRTLQLEPRPGLWKAYPFPPEAIDRLIAFAESRGVPVEDVVAHAPSYEELVVMGNLVVYGVELAGPRCYVINDTVEKFLREFAKNEPQLRERIRPSSP